MIATTGYCVTYPLLGMVKTYDIWLLAYVILHGAFNATYWHCYHTFYSLAGEHEHRGKQLSVALGLSTAVSALSPLLSALFITQTSFQTFFFLPLPLLLVLLCALARSEELPVVLSPWSEGKKLIFNLGAKLHLADASAAYPLNIGWMFVVYFFVGQMVTLGSILTFGILAQIVYELWLGRLVDGKLAHVVAHAGGMLRITQVILKAIVPLSFSRILCLETLKGGTSVHHELTYCAAKYNAAKHSGDPFWYWLFAETGFDLGAVVGAGGVALLLLCGVNLQTTILVALPGVVAIWRLTQCYFLQVHAGPSKRGSADMTK